jgi:Methyltransferase domain
MTARLAFDTAVIRDTTWQMTYGERFALEGLLSQLKPRLAIETGTAQGGSLRRIAAHTDEVHAFDLVPAVADLAEELPNAHFHIGDSAILLPQVLSEFESAERHVDFALIDGDHSFEGVQRDTRAILDSAACRHTVIVFHDAANDEVRGGLEAMDLPSHPRVALCMLDFVPGYICVAGHATYPLAIWNGLGLVVLDDRFGAEAAQTDTDHVHVAEAYRGYRDALSAESPEFDGAGRSWSPAALAGASAIGALIGAGAMRILGRST